MLSTTNKNQNNFKLLSCVNCNDNRQQVNSNNRQVQNQPNQTNNLPAVQQESHPPASSQAAAGQQVQQIGPVLSLKSSTRDSLVSWLNQQSNYLTFMKVVDAHQTEMLLGKVEHLIISLVRLPVIEHLKIGDHGSINEECSFDFTLQLSSELRIKIIDQLIKNKNYAIIYNQQNVITPQLRNIIKAENDSIVEQLGCLPSKRSETQQQCKKMMEMNDEVTIDDQENQFITKFQLDERLEELEDVVYGNTKEGIMNRSTYYEKAEAEIEDLRLQLHQLRDEMKRKISKVNIFKKNVSFFYCLGDLEELFRHALSPPLYSDLFYCVGLPWSLSFKVNEKKSITDPKTTIKYLGVFLQSHNNSDYTNWSVDVSCEIRLINRAGKDRTLIFDYTFKDAGDRGARNFVSFNDLMFGGFRENNSIHFEVKLSCWGLERRKD